MLFLEVFERKSESPQMGSLMAGHVSPDWGSLMAGHVSSGLGLRRVEVALILRTDCFPQRMQEGEGLSLEYQKS